MVNAEYLFFFEKFREPRIKRLPCFFITPKRLLYNDAGPTPWPSSGISFLLRTSYCGCAFVSPSRCIAGLDTPSSSFLASLTI